MQQQPRRLERIVIAAMRPVNTIAHMSGIGDLWMHSHAQIAMSQLAAHLRRINNLEKIARQLANIRRSPLILSQQQLDLAVGEMRCVLCAQRMQQIFEKCHGIVPLIRVVICIVP